MPTLEDAVAAFVAARDYDAAMLSRLPYWVDALGDRELTDITPDHVDAQVVHLAERGRLSPTCNRDAVKTGKPLAPASINR